MADPKLLGILKGTETFTPKPTKNPFAGTDQWERLFDEASKRHGVSKSLLMATSHIENRQGDPRAKNPHSTATGLGQFIKSTAERFGIDPTDPAQSVDGMGQYYRYLLDMFEGDETKAVAAYHFGEGTIMRSGGPVQDADAGGTSNADYVRMVMAVREKLREREMGKLLSSSGLNQGLSRILKPAAQQPPQEPTSLAQAPETPLEPEGLPKRSIGATRSFDEEPPSIMPKMATAEPSSTFVSPHKDPAMSLGESAHEFIVKPLMAGAVAAGSAFPGVKTAQKLMGTREEAQAMQQENPISSAIGGAVGNIALVVASAPLAAKALSGRVASPLLSAAIRRVGTQIAIATGQNAEEVLIGEKELAKAAEDVARRGGAAAVSMLPEIGVSAEGARILAQLPAQVLADVAYDAVWDASKGRTLDVDWVLENLPGWGMSAGFAISDIKSGNQFRATQKAIREDIRGVAGKAKAFLSKNPDAKIEFIEAGTPVGRTLGQVNAEADVRDAYTGKITADQDAKVAALEAEAQQKPPAPPNREARRATVEEGMFADTPLVAQVREKYGDTRPTKARVAADFGVSREEAGSAIKQVYGGTGEPLGPVVQRQPAPGKVEAPAAEPHDALKQIGEQIAQELNVKFNGVWDPEVEGVKPLMTFTTVPNGEPGITFTAKTAEEAPVKLEEARKRFEQSGQTGETIQKPVAPGPEVEYTKAEGQDEVRVPDLKVSAEPAKPSVATEGPKQDVGPEVVRPDAESVQRGADDGKGSGAGDSRRATTTGDKPGEVESRLADVLPETIDKAATEGKAQAPDQRTSAIESIENRIARVASAVDSAKSEADADKAITDFASTFKSHEDVDAALARLTGEAPAKFESEAERLASALPLPEKSERKSFLKQQADAAAERLKGRESGQRLYSGFPADDAIDYAIIGANKIAEGVRGFGDWARSMVKDFGDTIKPILRDLYEQAKDYFRRVLTSEAGSVVLPGGKKASAKGVIQAATGVKKSPEDAAELKNLKAAFQKVQRYSKQSYSAGRATARAEMFAVQSAKNANVESYKAAAISYLKDKSLPPEKRAKLLVRFSQIDTEKGVQKFADAVDRLEQEVLREDATGALEKALKQARRHKLRPEYKKLVDTIVDAYDPQKMTERTRERLERLRSLQDSEIWRGIPDRVKDRIKRLDKTPISELSTDEVLDVTEQLTRLMAQSDMKTKLKYKGKVREYNAELEQAKTNIEASPWKRKLVAPEEEGAISQDPFAHRGTGKKTIDAVIGIDSENPELFLERMEGVDIDNERAVISPTVYGGMNEGETTRLRINREIRSEFGKKAKELGLDPSKLSHVVGMGGRTGKAVQKKIREIGQVVDLDSGAKLRLTPAQRMSIYNLAKNDHALKGMLTDGIKTDTGISNPSATKLTIEDIDRVIGGMSDKERAIADYMFEVVNTRTKELINSTSVEMDGQELATVDNYWRAMRTDRYQNYLKQGERPGVEFGSHVSNTLEGSGSLKARVASARGAVVIEDAFRSFYDSVNLAATYNGYAWNIRQAKQLLNDLQGTAKAAGMQRELYAAQQYLRDIEGNISQPQMSEYEGVIREFIGRATTGALGYNPFVMAKQVASLPFALTEIDAKYLAKGSALLPGKQSEAIREKIRQNSPQLAERIESGSVSMELGGRASAHEVDAFFGGAKMSASEVGTRGIKFFDEAVILRIYAAAEAKIADTRPDLKGEEFDRAAADLAEKIVRRTQPTYSMKDRSKIHRDASKSTWLKLATSFTSVTNKVQQMYKREALRLDRSDKKPEDYAKFFTTIGGIWLSSAGLVTAIDEMRDRLWGREFDPVKSFGRLMKYTFSPIFFTAPAIGAAQSVIDSARKGRVSILDYEMASNDLIGGMGAQFVKGASELGAGALNDMPIKTGDWKRVARGTEKMLDVLAKATTGVSPSGLYSYGIRLPMSVAQKLTKPEDRKTLDKYLREANYKPSVSKYMTADKEKYKLTQDVVKEIEDLMYAIAEKQASKFLDEKWSLLEPKEKSDLMKFVFQNARKQAIEVVSSRQRSKPGAVPVERQVTK